MPDNTCPVCEQRPSEKRIKFLTKMYEAVNNYYSDQVPHFDASTLEVLVRIDGKVVEIIPPGAFELVTDDEDDE